MTLTKNALSAFDTYVADLGDDDSAPSWWDTDARSSTTGGSSPSPLRAARVLTWDEREAIRSKERTTRRDAFYAGLPPGMTQAERKAAKEEFSRKLRVEHEAWLAAMSPQERAEYEKGLAVYNARIEAERIRIEAEYEAKSRAKLRADAKAEVTAELKEKTRAKKEARAVAAERHRKKTEAKREAKTEIIEEAGEPGKFVRPQGGGAPLPNNQDNIALAIKKLGVVITFDEFAARAKMKGFWKFGSYVDDAANAALRLVIESKFKFRPSKDYFYDVIDTIARRNAFHPIKDYLASLKWDGTPRLDTWMTAYLGAEDTPLNHAIGSIWMIAAVRRIRQPGCKFDEMPVFESPQGKEKSTMLSELAGGDEYFTDNVPLNVDAKKVIEQTRGKWVIEVADLSGMSKADIEHVKALLSRRVDESRLSYGRLTESVPRAFVIAGTTNDDRYLKDLTGNRRFWPVKVGKIDLTALRRDRNQLWAEAAHREAAAESIRLDQSLWPDAAKVQEARQIENPFLDRLAEALGSTTGKISAESVYMLAGLEPTKRAQAYLTLVGAAMKALGWEKTKLRFDGAVPLNCFARGDAANRMLALTVIWDVNTKRYEVREPDMADRMAANIQGARGP